MEKEKRVGGLAAVHSLAGVEEGGGSGQFFRSTPSPRVPSPCPAYLTKNWAKELGKKSQVGANFKPNRCKKNFYSHSLKNRVLLERIRFFQRKMIFFGNADCRVSIRADLFKSYC